MIERPARRLFWQSDIRTATGTSSTLRRPCELLGMNSSVVGGLILRRTCVA